MLDVVVVGGKDFSTAHPAEAWATVHRVEVMPATIPGEASWVLLLDSCDRITEDLQEAIKTIVNVQQGPDRYQIGVRVTFAGGVLRHCGVSSLGGVRLFRRTLGRDEGRLGPRLVQTILREETVEGWIARGNEATQPKAEEGCPTIPGMIGSGPTSPLRAFFTSFVLKGGLLDGHTGFRFSQFLAATHALRNLKLREQTLGKIERSAERANGEMSGDIPVTVVVPVLNEEKNLPACLARLHRFAHVLVVDSGSRDRTCAIAEEFGAQVLNFAWNGRFPKKRNWTLRNHTFTTEFVLFLDADEYVSEAFCDEVKAKTGNTTHDGFWLSFHNFFLGQFLKHGTAFTKLALLRVGAGEYERIDEERWSHLDMEVHEHPILKGTTGEIAAPIEHDDYKGLDAYVRRHNEYSTWEAQRYRTLMAEGDALAEGFTRRQRMKYRAVRRWWMAPMYFLVSFFLQRGILDGRAGFSFALMKWIYFSQIRLKILEADSRLS